MVRHTASHASGRCALPGVAHRDGEAACPDYAPREYDATAQAIEDYSGLSSPAATVPCPPSQCTTSCRAAFPSTSRKRDAQVDLDHGVGHPSSRCPRSKHHTDSGKGSLGTLPLMLGTKVADAVIETIAPGIPRTK